MGRSDRPPPITVVDFLTDPQLLGRFFMSPSWRRWLVCVKTAFGLSIDEAGVACMQQCTGRDRAPCRPVRELWAIVGRRAGKSTIAAALTVYLACCRSYD